MKRIPGSRKSKIMLTGQKRCGSIVNPQALVSPDNIRCFPHPAAWEILSDRFVVQIYQICGYPSQQDFLLKSCVSCMFITKINKYTFSTKNNILNYKPQRPSYTKVQHGVLSLDKNPYIN